MAEKKKAESEEKVTGRKKCGIVIPIAGFNGYPEEHWRDVKEIIIDAADQAGFDAELVSYRNETTVIHKTIIQNLYTNEIVVVDVSGRNPNVMFELGMRLAFDKPTIVIKDEKTDYSFDTSPIDHLGYPSSLHYQTIKDFKGDLIRKIKATYEASQKDGYSSFLKNFTNFTIASIENREVTPSEFILEELKSIRRDLNTISSPTTLIKESREDKLRRYYRAYLAYHNYSSQLVLTSVTVDDFVKWVQENTDRDDSYFVDLWHKSHIVTVVNLPSV